MIIRPSTHEDGTTQVVKAAAKMWANLQLAGANMTTTGQTRSEKEASGETKELDRIFPGTKANQARDIGHGLEAITLPGGNGKIECHVVRVKNPGAH